MFTAQWSVPLSGSLTDQLLLKTVVSCALSRPASLADQQQGCSLQASTGLDGRRAPGAMLQLYYVHLIANLQTELTCYCHFLHLHHVELRRVQKRGRIVEILLKRSQSIRHCTQTSWSQTPNPTMSDQRNPGCERFRTEEGAS